MGLRISRNNEPGPIGPASVHPPARGPWAAVVRHRWWFGGLVVALACVAGGSRLLHRPPGAGSGNEQARPESPLDPARRAIAVRDFGEAKQRLREYLAARPQDPQAHFLLAQTCRRSGDLDGWRFHLGQAEVEHCPPAQIGQERHLYLLQTGRVGGRQVFLENYLVSHPPEEVLILELLVRSYLDNNLLPDVLRLTTAWIERHPEDPLPYLDRGLAKLRLQRDGASLALEDLRRALELNPGLAEVRLALATAHVRELHWQEALAQFQACLTIRPHDAQALLGVAECQLALSEPAAAAAALDALPERHRRSARACLLRAKLAWVAGKPAEARNWLERGQAAAPNNLEVVRTLGLVALQTDHPAEAERCHQRYDELTRQQARLAELAVQILKAPRDADLRYQAALTNLRFGREPEAENCFRAALWLDPKHRPTLTAYADLLARRGEAARAAELRHTVEQLGPENHTNSP